MCVLIANAANGTSALPLLVRLPSYCCSLPLAAKTTRMRDSSAPRPHRRPRSAPPCPTHQASRAHCSVAPDGYTEEGIASWYGVPYHGRPAADGEIYDMETLVAAHRTMPFNTWLKVTNLTNGLSVNVRVIDRGPFVGDRIIDLSKRRPAQIRSCIGPGHRAAFDSR